MTVPSPIPLSNVGLLYASSAKTHEDDPQSGGSATSVTKETVAMIYDGIFQSPRFFHSLIVYQKGTRGWQCE